MSEVLIIMPFGQREYLQSQTTIRTDYDELYSQFIKIAVAQAGHISVRIDELTDGGSIAGQYINRIVSADLERDELIPSRFGIPKGRRV